MNTLQTLVTALSLTALQALPAQEPDGQRLDEARLVEAMNRFAADLHSELATTGSPTCSPASISFALLMLLPGARGNTADEVATMLHLPADLRGTKLHKAAAALLEKTARMGTCGFGDGPQLRITNDFWGQQGHEFVPAYRELLKSAFGSYLHEVDFKSDHESARQAINKRIAAATNQRIPELLPPGAVGPDTRTVISNAIWYRGEWVHDFYRPERLSKFHVSKDRTVNASMMHLTNTLYYAECAQWQAVSLPFKDHAVVFELVVPRKGQSLKDAEKALLTGDILKKRNAERVQLSMPAFKVSGAHRLRAPLNALGMRDAFINGRANFTGIDNKQPLFLGNVMHGVWIAVDERGVEAAAATALMSKCGAVKIAEPPKRILADRPFAFAMRDQRTGLLLFVGRLNDPTVGA